MRKQRWQINDTIKAARVVLNLMYAGFEIIPTNISQAVALARLGEEELVEKWRSVINILPLDKITAKSIRTLVFPSTESDRAVATIKVPAKVHEDIHREAAERGLSIVELITVMLYFFLGARSYGELSPNLGVNSHFLKHETDTEYYFKKEQIWQSDLKDLVQEGKVKPTYDVKYS